MLHCPNLELIRSRLISVWGAEFIDWTEFYHFSELKAKIEKRHLCTPLNYIFIWNMVDTKSLWENTSTIDKFRRAFWKSTEYCQSPTEAETGRNCATVGQTDKPKTISVVGRGNTDYYSCLISLLFHPANILRTSSNVRLRQMNNGSTMDATMLLTY